MKRFINILHLSLSIILAPLSILAFLSANDIYKNVETDLSEEWSMMSIFFYAAFIYILLNIIRIFYRK